MLARQRLRIRMQGFIEIVILVCAVTDPNQCEDKRLQFAWQGSLKQCVMAAQPYMAQWIGDKLMIESERVVQGATLKQKEIWSLSADGKTLTVDAHVTLPNGEFDVKQVFEKQ
jgi:hypothetical protein